MKIKLERMPRGTWFLPDFHNRARGRREQGLDFPFGEAREISVAKDISPVLIFKVAQKFGMPLWMSCTRLKTQEIKLR